MDWSKKKTLYQKVGAESLKRKSKEYFNNLIKIKFNKL